MDPQRPSALELTQELIKIDSCNPPGGEAQVVEFLSPLLAEAGYELTLDEFAPGRPSLIASQSWGPEPPLCFSGHLDTVPLGSEAWNHNPLEAQIEEGRLYGRGASDMKSGIAAMVVAARCLAAAKPSRSGLVLALSAAEETGCEGSFHLAKHPEVLGGAAAVLVGEPTANRPLLGHKGALWLRVSWQGKAAHGSMPHLGDNAAIKAARGALALHEHDFGVSPHPYLGAATLNLGIISGGHKVNIVPDRAEVRADLRTLPGQSHDKMAAAVAALLPEAQIERFKDAEAIWSEPDDPWVSSVFAIAAKYLGEPPQPAGAPYFTDGSALKGALGGAPTVLLGPGQAETAHTVDEWCLAGDIQTAAEMYLDIARAWCGI